MINIHILTVITNVLSMVIVLQTIVLDASNWLNLSLTLRFIFKYIWSYIIIHGVITEIAHIFYI